MIAISPRAVATMSAIKSMMRPPPPGGVVTVVLVPVLLTVLRGVEVDVVMAVKVVDDETVDTTTTVEVEENPPRLAG